LAIKASAVPEFWQAIGESPELYDALNLSSALHNIAVSTAGNLVGGSLMVGAVYWFVHLRNRPPTTAS
jgi:formate transporter